uniref:Calmodulin n=1 Tax=Heterosigma akashiwo TaxID=2829 RepID=A0A6V1WZY9_HETAK
MEMKDLLVNQPFRSLKRTFYRNDPDGDGYISFPEFKKCLKSFGISAEGATEISLKKLFDSYDLDGNEHIDFSEFLMLTADQIDIKGAEEEIRHAFQYMDTNCDGRVSKNELSHVIGIVDPTLTKEEIALLLSEADAGADGEFDFEEFLAFALEQQGTHRKQEMRQARGSILSRARSEKFEAYLKQSSSFFDDMRLHGGLTPPEPSVATGAVAEGIIEEEDVDSQEDFFQERDAFKDTLKRNDVLKIMKKKN